MGFFTDLIGGAINSYIENKDTDDTLRTLVFLLGYNEVLSKNDKKLIVETMRVLDDDATMFEYEEKIDSIQNEFSTKSFEEFFSDILSTRIDREKIVAFFTYNVLTFLKVCAEETVKPTHMYNLYLLKKQFQLTKVELKNCYQVVAGVINLDFDDVAEKIEMFTGEEAINELIKKYPNIISGKSTSLIENNDEDFDDEEDEEDDEDFEESDDDEDSDEFDYEGNTEDGEQLLNKWNNIFLRNLEDIFDFSELSIEKDDKGFIDFTDSEKQISLITSNDFELDDDGYFIIIYSKNGNNLLFSYHSDDDDNMEFDVCLSKGNDISLEFKLTGIDTSEFQDFIDYMENLDMTIPDDFVKNQRNFIIQLNKMYKSGNSENKYSDLDDF